MCQHNLMQLPGAGGSSDGMKETELNIHYHKSTVSLTAGCKNISAWSANTLLFPCILGNLVPCHIPTILYFEVTVEMTCNTLQ